MFVPFDRDSWAQEFAIYMAALFSAICQAALAVGVLSLNLRPVNSEDWRRRSRRSGFAVLLIDIMAIEYAVFGFRVLCLHRVIYLSRDPSDR